MHLELTEAMINWYKKRRKEENDLNKAGITESVSTQLNFELFNAIEKELEETGQLKAILKEIL